MIIHSEYAAPSEATTTNLISMLMRKTTKFGNKIALVNSETDERFTYNELNSNVRHIGASLYYNHGLRKGDVIFMLSPNCPEYIFLVLGAVSVGILVSTASPQCTIGEAVAYMNESNPKCIITTPDYLAKFQQACDVRNKRVKFITIGDDRNCTSYRSLLQNKIGNRPFVEFNSKMDVALLPYSSGTTGTPKGVMLTHLNLQSYLLQSTVRGMRAFGGDRNAVIVLFLPLYHIYALTQSLASCFNGMCVVLMAKYDLKTFINNATYLPIVPPTVVQLTKHDKVKASDFDSVKTFSYGAAPVGPDVEKEFMQKFPKQIVRQGYGLTETTAGLIRSPEDGNHKPGAAGKVMPGIEARVVNPDTLKDCEVGEDGEIWCRGNVIMKGYYNKPEETKKVLTTNGWFRTGDIGHVDEDGYFYVVDRLKELIKYNAYQVPPAELESLLLSHNCIEDCAVVGVPNREAGELPRAYVVLKSHRRATEKEIQDFIAEQVSPHKRLRGGVVFTDSVPKSPSGKILRRVLKEKIRREMQAKL